MKKFAKIITVALAAALMSMTAVMLTACGGLTVTFELPDGISGTTPAAVSCEAYGQITLPDVTDAETASYLKFAGWEDPSGTLYAAGSKFNVGSESVTLKAAFRGYELITSYCENPGTISMSQGRFIGPTPAYTVFNSDGTWTADAYGGAIEGHFKGTFDISSDGKLKVVIGVQDGITKNEEITVTDEGRTFGFTLSHPGDSANSIKNHKNHVSKHHLIKAWNAARGTSIAVPDEPEFTMTFRGVASRVMFGNVIPSPQDAEGSMDTITAKVGQELTLPECGYTRAGYKFDGWQILDGETTTAKAGEKYIMVSCDVYIEAMWAAE